MNNLAEKNNFSSLHYEFTTNEFYLQQYAQLVIEYYKKELNLDLEGHNMARDLCNQKDNERVFIVRDGDKVVAGTKLTFSSTHAAELLPMESEAFRVQTLLPENFADESYAEIGRLVVDPAYRGKEVLAEIITSLAYYTYRHGGGYLFVLAPPINAVLYRRVCKGLNMNVQAHKGVNWGNKAAYSHLDLQLISCDIRGVYGQVEEELPIAV